VHVLKELALVNHYLEIVRRHILLGGEALGNVSLSGIQYGGKLFLCNWERDM